MHNLEIKVFLNIGKFQVVSNLLFFKFDNRGIILGTLVVGRKEHGVIPEPSLLSQFLLSRTIQGEWLSKIVVVSAGNGLDKTV